MIAEAMRFHDELRAGAEAHGGDYDVAPDPRPHPADLDRRRASAAAT